ncbi:hypothetical protein ACTQ6A_05085 [Lachnospiraceae bacterium LCP25S3_G4]
MPRYHNLFCVDCQPTFTIMGKYGKFVVTDYVILLSESKFHIEVFVAGCDSLPMV